MKINGCLVPLVCAVLAGVVMAAEWPERYPIETLKAGAIATKQFAWYFHYPGADGKFGPTTAAKIDKNSAMAEGQIGLDRKHPDGKDELLVPVEPHESIIKRTFSIDR